MKQLRSFSKSVRELTPARGVMFLLGMGLILWGLWVGNPFVLTFDSSFYSLMADLGEESAWAALAIGAGLSTVIGVIRRDVFLVRCGAMLGFFFWLTVSLLYGLSDPTVTPVVTNFILAMLHGWVFIQLKLRPEHIYQNVEVKKTADALFESKAPEKETYND